MTYQPSEQGTCFKWVLRNNRKASWQSLYLISPNQSIHFNCRGLHAKKVYALKPDGGVESRGSHPRATRHPPSSSICDVAAHRSLRRADLTACIPLTGADTWVPESVQLADAYGAARPRPAAATSTRLDALVLRGSVVIAVVSCAR